MYNFSKIILLKKVFLDFQNFPEWGRRINATNTKTNGTSESWPPHFRSCASWLGLGWGSHMVVLQITVIGYFFIYINRYIEKNIGKKRVLVKRTRLKFKDFHWSYKPILILFVDWASYSNLLYFGSHILSHTFLNSRPYISLVASKIFMFEKQSNGSQAPSIFYPGKNSRSKGSREKINHAVKDICAAKIHSAMFPMAQLTSDSSEIFVITGDRFPYRKNVLQQLNWMKRRTVND